MENKPKKGCMSPLNRMKKQIAKKSKDDHFLEDLCRLELMLEDIKDKTDPRSHELRLKILYQKAKMLGLEKQNPLEVTSGATTIQLRFE